MPIFFIIYWDGKALRGYIPLDGNPWNTTTKQAYGNNNEDDLDDAKTRYPGFDGDWQSIDFDSEKIIEDILKRIQPKLSSRIYIEKSI